MYGEKELVALFTTNTTEYSRLDADLPYENLMKFSESNQNNSDWEIILNGLFGLLVFWVDVCRLQ